MYTPGAVSERSDTAKRRQKTKKKREKKPENLARREEINQASAS
jgi:hypothetical protein